MGMNVLTVTSFLQYAKRAYYVEVSLSIPPLKLSYLADLTRFAKYPFDLKLIFDITIKPYDNGPIMVYVDKSR